MNILFNVQIGETYTGSFGQTRWRDGMVSKCGEVTCNGFSEKAIKESVKQYEELLRMAVAEKA